MARAQDIMLAMERHLKSRFAPDGLHRSAIEDLYCVHVKDFLQIDEPCICCPCIMLLLRGEMDLRIGGHGVSLRRGDVFLPFVFMPARADIKCDADGSFMALLLRLKPDTFAEFCKIGAEEPSAFGDCGRSADEAPAPGFFSTAACSDFIECMSRLVDCEVSQRRSAFLSKGIIETLYGMLFLSPAGRHICRTMRSEVMKICRHLCRSLERQVLVEQTIRNCSTPSQSFVYRRFSEFTGHTPQQYHRHLRIIIARIILRACPDVTMLRLSTALGFTSQQYFSRSYKNFFGTPPSDDSREGRNISEAERRTLINQLCLLTPLPFDELSEILGSEKRMLKLPLLEFNVPGDLFDKKSDAEENTRAG